MWMVKILIIATTHSARLREENARLREPDAYKKSKIPRSGAASPAQRSSISDDDQSIVDVPPSNGGLRTANYCAACRTRDSRIWWKAPKGLATPILCDSCGMNWRKYADLNARPTTREESAMSGSSSASITVTAPTGAKTRGAEKREGTPLSAPAAKRSKVCTSRSIVIITHFHTHHTRVYRSLDPRFRRPVRHREPEFHHTTDASRVSTTDRTARFSNAMDVVSPCTRAHAV